MTDPENPAIVFRRKFRYPCSNGTETCKGAIEAVREEIAILSSDWDSTTCETVDQHLRNITRLEAKLPN